YDPGWQYGSRAHWRSNEAAPWFDGAAGGTPGEARGWSRWRSPSRLAAPRSPVAGACHAATAASVNHTVRLPRRTSAASYSGQFATRYLAFGILWRRPSLNLYGMGSTARSVGRHSLSYGPATKLAIRPGLRTQHFRSHDARGRTPAYNLWSIHAPTHSSLAIIAARQTAAPRANAA